MTLFPVLGFDNDIKRSMESKFIPEPNTLLSQAMEFKEQAQSMEVEEAKEQVVYRRRKMKCAGTQTL